MIKLIFINKIFTFSLLSNIYLYVQYIIMDYKLYKYKKNSFKIIYYLIITKFLFKKLIKLFL